MINSIKCRRFDTAQTVFLFQYEITIQLFFAFAHCLLIQDERK